MPFTITHTHNLNYRITNNLSESAFALHRIKKIYFWHTIHSSMVAYYGFYIMFFSGHRPSCKLKAITYKLKVIPVLRIISSTFKKITLLVYNLYFGV